MKSHFSRLHSTMLEILSLNSLTSLTICQYGVALIVRTPPCNLIRPSVSTCQCRPQAVKRIRDAPTVSNKPFLNMISNSRYPGFKRYRLSVTIGGSRPPYKHPLHPSFLPFIQPTIRPTNNQPTTNQSSTKTLFTNLPI
jgi:hypothetical protein